MNRLHCLLLLLLAFLLSGCVSASGSYGVPALDDTEEHYSDYEYDDVSDEYVAKDDAVNYVWVNYRAEILDRVYEAYTPWDIFEEECADIQIESYFEGYDEAENGYSPSYYRPGEEPELNDDVIFVANTAKKRYHTKFCTSVEQISEENKMFWSGPEEDLAALGYTPHSCVTNQSTAEADDQAETTTTENEDILDDYSEYDSFDYSSFDVIETQDSTAFKEIGYDAKDSRLFLRFRNSGRYIYSDVPETVWQELKDADSKGGYFNQKIKGHYAYERIG